MVDAPVKPKQKYTHKKAAPQHVVSSLQLLPQAAKARVDTDEYDDDCDLIDRIFSEVLSIAPERRAEFEQLARRVRSDWAGAQAYFGVASARRERDNNLRADYRAGERIALLAKRYAITERRVLQIIKAP